MKNTEVYCERCATAGHHRAQCTSVVEYVSKGCSWPTWYRDELNKLGAKEGKDYRQAQSTFGNVRFAVLTEFGRHCIELVASNNPTKIA